MGPLILRGKNDSVTPVTLVMSPTDPLASGAWMERDGNELCMTGYGTIKFAGGRTILLRYTELWAQRIRLQQDEREWNAMEMKCAQQVMGPANFLGVADRFCCVTRVMGPTHSFATRWAWKERDPNELCTTGYGTTHFLGRGRSIPFRYTGYGPIKSVCKKIILRIVHDGNEICTTDYGTTNFWRGVDRFRCVTRVVSPTDPFATTWTELKRDENEICTTGYGITNFAGSRSILWRVVEWCGSWARRIFAIELSVMNSPPTRRNEPERGANERLYIRLWAHCRCRERNLHDRLRDHQVCGKDRFWDAW